MTTPPPPRLFQFRLATLLILTTWVGLTCVALKTPTYLWATTTCLVTFAALLICGITIVSRRGPARAFAVGFVFGVALLAPLISAEGLLIEHGGGGDQRFQSVHFGMWLMRLLHPKNYQLEQRDDGSGPMHFLIGKYSPQHFKEIVRCTFAIISGALIGTLARAHYLTRRQPKLTPDSPAPKT